MIPEDKITDHLFRSEFGKVVASLTSMFGVRQLELIEDAVQDAFQKAIVKFRQNPIPDNPEAWIVKVARNRAIDLLRKQKVEEKYQKLSGTSSIAMTEVFSEHEIEDNQLRLLFTICHPSLKTRDQVIFALKSFSGFSHEEIANALLISKENIKKILSRARKNIIDKNITFDVPVTPELEARIEHIHLVLYLLFNEGFHSSGRSKLLREDLLIEAMRLSELLDQRFQKINTKALRALMCLHAARLHSKVDVDGNLIKLKYQDRSLWNSALIFKGNLLMQEATNEGKYSRYHYEAAIASEYVKAGPFEKINWSNVEIFQKNLIALQNSPINQLNLCVIVNLQGRSNEALILLKKLSIDHLKGKEHLYHSVAAEIYNSLGEDKTSLEHLKKAFHYVKNQAERTLIFKKIKNMQNKQAQT